MRAEMRPRPAMALVGNYLLMSFSSRSMDFIEHAIDTAEGEEMPMIDDDEANLAGNSIHNAAKTFTMNDIRSK